MWIEVQIETTPDGADLVAAEVGELCGGVEIRDSGVLLAAAAGRASVVAHCLPDRLDELLAVVDGVLSVARDAGTVVDPVAIRQRPAHEDEWRDKWKQFFRATRIGRGFIVRPSWDPTQIAAGEHIIDLDPGRAFGTGAHPSTRLVIGCAERLRDERAVLGRFLDLGCGSGILSIAAARLWPEAVGLAMDVDPEATACTVENLERNAVASVAVEIGSLDRADGQFDLIMANIQADVLHELAPLFAPRLVDGGSVVLSGLLTSDVEAVVARFARPDAGLRVHFRDDDGEWAALVLGR